MKKLVMFWINGTQNYKTKFSAADMNQISEQLLQSWQTKPAEINRPSRSLSCVSFWKATEFRTFLLKLGAVVLQNYLSRPAYNHFLALFCATTICCNPDFLPYLSVAEKLFTDFVDNFGDIYGDENSSYTVHSLIHVTDDVQHYGVLDNYSTQLSNFLSLVLQMSRKYCFSVCETFTLGHKVVDNNIVHRLLQQSKKGETSYLCNLKKVVTGAGAKLVHHGLGSQLSMGAYESSSSKHIMNPMNHIKLNSGKSMAVADRSQYNGNM